MKYYNIVITGTGSYIPTKTVTNKDFEKYQFYDMEGKAYEESHDETTEKFKAITGIEERRYAADDLVASDMGTLAAHEAIEDAGL